MTLDVNVILIDMPPSIPAYSVANPDLSYTIVLNSRLNYERQLRAYHHEMEHIKNGDFEKKCSADIIEFCAHAVK